MLWVGVTERGTLAAPPGNNLIDFELFSLIKIHFIILAIHESIQLTNGDP